MGETFDVLAVGGINVVRVSEGRLEGSTRPNYNKLVMIAQRSV
jgi:hypothetical protein